MTEPSGVSDKINTTLITILLTALGTIAFQSVKYLAFDYWAFHREQMETIAAKITSQQNSFTRIKKFKKNVDDVENRLQERDKFITPFYRGGFIKLIDGAKTRQHLAETYTDLGSIAYIPVNGTPFEPYRAAVVDQVKSQIDALEIIERQATRQERHKLLTNDEAYKVSDELRHTVYHQAEAGAAVVAASSVLDTELDLSSNDATTYLAKAKNERHQHDIWFVVAMLVFALTGLLYIRLLRRITATLMPNEIPPAKAATE
jgi:hypothetical protein